MDRIILLRIPQLRLAILLIFISLDLIAQESKIKPLIKGATVPDLIFKVYTGDSFSIHRLSDYRGKMLLLDYWGVNCVDCIGSMPKILSLREKFKDKMEVLLVTQNSRSDIKRLCKRFEKNPTAKKWIDASSQLPFVTDDSIVYRLFPHIGNPVHIWIDPTGNYKMTAYPSSTTIQNISSLLNNEPVPLDELRYAEFDSYSPLTWIDSSLLGLNNVRYYSFITRHIEFGGGWGTFFAVLKDTVSKQPLGLSCVNKTILELYKIAYSEWFSSEPVIPDNRIILETINPFKFTLPEYYPDIDKCWKEWFDYNSYCYASMVYNMPLRGIYSKMQQDIDRYFSVISRIEKRKVLCLVLKRRGRLRETCLSGVQEAQQLNDKLVLYNIPINNLHIYLANCAAYKFPLLPFFNEAGSKGKVSFSLPIPEDYKQTSFDKLNQTLLKYNLILSREYRNINMLILTDKGLP
ncbi:MAG: redoxin domain-containing protein [Chitinophagaceae bacterium]